MALIPGLDAAGATPPGAVVQAAGAFAGGLLGAVGGAFDAELEQRSLRRNAVLARMAATSAIQRGSVLASNARTAGGKLRGSQQAAFAESGVAVGQGSAADVDLETAALVERDAQIIQANAALEAFGFTEKAGQFDESVRTSKRQAVIGGIQSVLGGSANVASALL